MHERAEPTIAELRIPARLGTRDSVAFEEMVAVMNGVAVALWQNDDFVYTAEAELASVQPEVVLVPSGVYA